MRTIVIISLILCVGCSPIYYTPEPMVMPHHSGEKELQLGGGIHLEEWSGGLQLAGSYSLNKNIFFSSSFTRFSGEMSVNGQRTGSGSGTSFQLAPGYYTRLGKYGAFESQFGYAFCNARNYQRGEGTSTASYGKLFFQPSIGYHGDQFFISAGIRLGQVKYQTFQYSNVHPHNYPVDELRKGFFVAEPGIQLGFGKNNGWIYFSSTYTEWMSDMTFNNKQNITFGLSFQYTFRFLKKPNS